MRSATTDSNIQMRLLQNEITDVRLQLNACNKEVASLRARLNSQRLADEDIRRGPWNDDEKLDMLSSLPMQEMEVLGQIFLGVKVSEILMNQTVARMFGYNISLQNMQVGFSGTPLLAISVPVLAKEASNGTLAPSTMDQMSARMERWGVVVLRSVLPAQACDDIANYILEGPEGILNPTYEFKEVAESSLRKDYPLPIDTVSIIFFDRVMKLVGLVLKAKLSEDASLVEFSSLTTFPNARQQDLHPDAQMETMDQARIYTVFVYLTDVEDDRAALDVQPGTHTHFQFMLPSEIDMLVSTPLVRCSVPKGSIVIMDSRLFHRGNANHANKTRAAFYFSFAEPGPAPDGPTYSLRRYYKHQITLRDAIQGKMLDKALARIKRRSKDDLQKDLQLANVARADVEQNRLGDIHEL